MFDQGINQDFGFDNSIIGNNNVINNDMNVDVEMTGYNNSIMPQQNMVNMNEGVQQRVINRTYVHEVPHTCPIHTRIINHHVYKHTYRPVYTCSEENTVSNIQCGSCGQFR
jgi:hypothetical protein